MNRDKDLANLYLLLAATFIIALAGMTLGIIHANDKSKAVKQFPTDVGCSKHGGIDRRLIDTVGFTDYSHIVIPCKDGSLVRMSYHD